MELSALSLRLRALSVLRGLLPHPLMRAYGDTLTALDGTAADFADRYGGGESMLQLAQRIYNLLDELKADTDKTYLLVAHNGIARVVQSYFYDMTNEEYAAAGIRNCELVEYHFE